jgi:hypothetical protein
MLSALPELEELVAHERIATEPELLEAGEAFGHEQNVDVFSRAYDAMRSQARRTRDGVVDARLVEPSGERERRPSMFWEFGVFGAFAVSDLCPTARCPRRGRCRLVLVLAS